jgi:hypothetical protein
MGVRLQDVVGFQTVDREQDDGSSEEGYREHRPGILYQEPSPGLSVTRSMEGWAKDLKFHPVQAIRGD